MNLDPIGEPQNEYRIFIMALARCMQQEVCVSFLGHIYMHGRPFRTHVSLLNFADLAVNGMSW